MAIKFALEAIASRQWKLSVKIDTRVTMDFQQAEEHAMLKKLRRTTSIDMTSSLSDEPEVKSEQEEIQELFQQFMQRT